MTTPPPVGSGFAVESLPKPASHPDDNGAPGAFLDEHGAAHGADAGDALARDPQTVFVLPECKSATPTVDSPRHDDDYHADRGNVKSQARTTDDALEAADITRVEQETVSAHSRGGEVIRKLMHDDPSGKSLRTNRLELHDSLHGSQRAVAAWGRTDDDEHVDKVIYVHGTNADGRDKEIAKAFKGAYVRIDSSHQRSLGDKSNPVVCVAKDAARDDHIHGKKGREGVRQFSPNAHYQTTGRFLAIRPLP